MNILENLKKAVEICMPNLRHYYRITKKARVVKSYASDGQYYCDVQPLRNDESVDEKEPLVPKVSIPVLWGGNNRGVVCPPSVGVLCDLSYYDGDPNYPFISNIRWDAKNSAPKAEVNEFVIQLENGVEIRIDAKKHIVQLTPETMRSEAGKDWMLQTGDNVKVTVGKNCSITAQKDITVTAEKNCTVTAGKEASLVAGSVANIVAPLINLSGRIIAKGYKGGKAYAEFEGDILIKGNETVKGNQSTTGMHTVGGSQNVGGNSHASSRTGGVCPHKC